MMHIYIYISVLCVGNVKRCQAAEESSSFNLSYPGSKQSGTTTDNYFARLGSRLLLKAILPAKKGLQSVLNVAPFCHVVIE